MSHIILALEDTQISNQLTSEIALNYKIVAPSFNDAFQATSIFSLFPDLKIIITSEKNHLEICNFLIKNSNEFNENIQVLVIGHNHSFYPRATSVPEGIAIDKLVQKIGLLLKLYGNSEEEEEVEEVEFEEKTTVFKLPPLRKLEAEEVSPEVEASADSEAVYQEYAAISMKYLASLKNIQIDFDIYARIKKRDDFDYILKIAANKMVSDADFERIKIRGGREIFVKKEQLAKAQEYFGSQFISRYSKSGLTNNERMTLNSESFEILLEVFKDSSFTKYSIEIIRELVKSYAVLIKTNSPMTVFFNAYKNCELSYGYVHSYLSCLMTFRIIDDFEWKKDQSANKIIYLSLFHDLSLQSSRLIKIHHNYFDEISKITEVEKQILSTHADASAVVLEKIVKAPKELTSLVREHHGLKHGVGFIEDLSIAASPLVMAFVVIESFVTKYLEFWEISNKDVPSEFVKILPEEIFEELSEKFNKLTYADVLSSLRAQFKQAP